MMEVALRVLKISLKIGIIMAMIFTLSVVITLTMSAINIGLNIGILNDLGALVQMWLPFNLSVIILWIVTVASSYLIFRLSVVAMSFANAWLES